MNDYLITIKTQIDCLLYGKPYSKQNIIRLIKTCADVHKKASELPISSDYKHTNILINKLKNLSTNFENICDKGFTIAQKIAISDLLLFIENLDVPVFDESQKTVDKCVKDKENEKDDSGDSGGDSDSHSKPEHKPKHPSPKL